MTLITFDGFETYGDGTEAGSEIEDRIDNTFEMRTVPTNPSFRPDTEDMTIVDDFETAGKALRFPTPRTGRTLYVEYEYPSAYQVSSNASAPDMACGFRYYNPVRNPVASPTNTDIFHLLQGSGSTLTQIQLDSDYTSLTMNPDSGSSVTATDVLTEGAWHYIEAEWKFCSAANGGYFKLYVDGVAVIDEASVNVATATFWTSYGLSIGIAGGNETTPLDPDHRVMLDDVYVMELDGVDHTEVLGDVRAKLLSPTSDATPNDWGPSTGGNNYALVDERDWDETDYVEGDVTADDDHYGLDTLAGASVHGLRVDAVVKATDGTPTLHIGFDNGTADESNRGIIGTATTVMEVGIFPLDPSGSAWTVSSVNSVEATQRMTE